MKHSHALLVAGALLVLAPAAAPADTVMQFEPIGAYDLELDGKVVTEGVKMYHSPQAGAVLLVAPQLPHPIAVVPANKTVQRIAESDLTEAALGALNWRSDGEKTAIATFELVESKPVFELGGKKVRFLDKPPLLGPRTIEEIVAFDPSYRFKAATAAPNLVYLDVLESWPDDVVVKIFFSTQCQVCRELMPGIIKVVEDFPNPRFKFEFYGLPLSASSDPVGRELGIKDFPTGIVYAGGKEVGRTSGHSWRMPPMAIHHALKGIRINPELLKEPSPPQPPPS
jgi:thiol-disulfide isomerase/thioredoxin